MNPPLSLLLIVFIYIFEVRSTNEVQAADPSEAFSGLCVLRPSTPLWTTVLPLVTDSIRYSPGLGSRYCYSGKLHPCPGSDPLDPSVDKVRSSFRPVRPPVPLVYPPERSCDMREENERIVRMHWRWFSSGGLLSKKGNKISKICFKDAIRDDSYDLHPKTDLDKNPIPIPYDSF
jgi:hypothetical protein